MAAAVERTGTSERAEAVAGGVSSPFLTEHTDIIGWLDVLLKGKSEDQARARTEIAMILEERGFADDAEEAYWTNVQAKSGDRRAYERLIALYRERKDKLSESLVRRKLEELAASPAASGSSGSVQPFAFGPLGAAGIAGMAGTTSTPASAATPSGAGQPGSRPVRRLRSAARRIGTAPTPERADNPRLRALPAPAAGPAQPQTFSAQLAAAEQPAATSLPVTPTGQPSAAIAQTAAAVSRASASGAPSVPSAAPVRGAAATPVRLGDAVPVEAADVEQIDLRARARQRSQGRYAALSPNPGRNAFGFSTNGLIVLQPATIAAFLMASVGAAMVISFAIIMMDRGSVVPVASAALQPQVASAASQVPPRCTDGTLRFPNANDPRAAVAAAYKAQGIDVDAPRPGGPRLTADQATLVVGGWMSVSLMMEHAGQQPPSLIEWLDPGSDRSTLANAVLAGRRLDGMVTVDEWATMRAWPASSCEGAFLRDPRNAGLVKQIERVVTK